MKDWLKPKLVCAISILASLCKGLKGFGCDGILQTFVSEIVSDSIIRRLQLYHRYRRRGLYRQQHR